MRSTTRMKIVTPPSTRAPPNISAHAVSDDDGLTWGTVSPCAASTDVSRVGPRSVVGSAPTIVNVANANRWVVLSTALTLWTLPSRTLRGARNLTRDVQELDESWPKAWPSQR